jgi:hypothetical protein
MTGEIRTVREGWLVRALRSHSRAGAAAGGSARTSRRSTSAKRDERRASLEEQLLLDRERRAARQELDRILSMSTVYRGL